MNHYDFNEIKELAETEPSKALRLHWEGDECEAEKTCPSNILSDIEDGTYTAQQFNDIGYCCTEEDYQEEQNQK